MAAGEFQGGFRSVAGQVCITADATFEAVFEIAEERGLGIAEQVFEKLFGVGRRLGVGVRRHLG